MFSDLFDNPLKILIIVAVLILLFGARKLPDAARSLGQSMRILKREVQGLHEENPDAVAAAEPPDPKQQQIEELQRQVRDLQQQASASDPVAANGSAAEQAQQTQQSG